MNRTMVVFFSLVCMVMLLLISCAQNEDFKKMEKENIAKIKYIHAEMAKGNIDVLDEVLAPNYVRHCQAMPPGLQEIHGSKQFKAFVGDFISAVSDYSETFDVIMADSDKVAYVTTMKGTQTGPMGGLPASGKKFTCVNIIIQRFEDGKVAETWVTWDNVAMLSQLGFFPPPPANSQP
jgi:predicted ester cyclase